MKIILLQQYPRIQSLFHEKTETYLKSFETIRVGDSTNYDEFCEINKENDQRKTYGIFLTELDHLTQSNYGETTCTMILEQIDQWMSTSSKDRLNEYIDNFAILSKYTIYHKEKIEYYTTLSTDVVGSRFLFTCMDILQL